MAPKRAASACAKKKISTKQKPPGMNTHEHIDEVNMCVNIVGQVHDALKIIDDHALRSLSTNRASAMR